MSQEKIKLNFEIPEDGRSAKVVITKDGISSHKTVSIEDIISKLASNYKFSTGLIPKNTRLFSGSKDKYLIAIETDSKIRTISTEKDGAWDSKIPFPPCLFVFDICDELIKKTYLFALKSPNVLSTDMLCHFPFGNVYTDGHVCWGRVTLPKISKPTDLVGVINVFFDSRFNGDLMERHSYTAIQGTNISGFNSLIGYLKNKDMFPIEMLRQTGESFDAMIKKAGDKNETT